MLPYLYAYLYSIHVSHSWHYTLNILHILAGEYSLYLFLLNTFHPIIICDFILFLWYIMLSPVLCILWIHPILHLFYDLFQNVSVNYDFAQVLN